MTPFLTINNLHVTFTRFGQSHEVLHGTSLVINRGDAVALVGESGSGKSVTAQAILRLLGDSGSITAGEILFDGIPLHNATEKEMARLRGKRIAMVFQDPMTSLNPTMTIGRQIAEVLIVHEKLSRAEAKAKTIELLKIVGIQHPEERYHAYPFQFSGGMRQRVLIAIAIACKPDLLIADEPTTALDVTVQKQILDLLKGLLQDFGMTMLFITHDLSIVERLCNRTAVMYRGAVVETADTQTLFKQPQHEYTRSLLEASLSKETPCV